MLIVLNNVIQLVLLALLYLGLVHVLLVFLDATNALIPLIVNNAIDIVIIIYLQVIVI